MPGQDLVLGAGPKDHSLRADREIGIRSKPMAPSDAFSPTQARAVRRGATFAIAKSIHSENLEVRMYRTRNDLPESARTKLVELLNARLADAIDLQTQCKQAHWNVKGPEFIALHKLFDEVNDAVEEYVDLIAERAVQLGGVADGTARVVAERSTLVDYPLALSSGAEHVAALSDA